MNRLLLLLLLLFAVAAPPGWAADSSAVGQGAATVAVPATNAEIRQWYNDQVAAVPALDDQWRQQGVSAEERARRAYAIRHQARLKARDFMPDQREVADLQARDREKYGNPDGPTFDDLVQKSRERGLTGDAVYEEIVGSSNRTDRGYNEQFGVRPPAQAP